MQKEYIEEVQRRFYEMYQPHSHRKSHGYEADGKQIVVYRNVGNNREIHVYLRDGFLRPFFPKR